MTTKPCGSGRWLHGKTICLAISPSLKSYPITVASTAVQGVKQASMRSGSDLGTVPVSYGTAGESKVLDVPFWAHGQPYISRCWAQCLLLDGLGVEWCIQSTRYERRQSVGMGGAKIIGWGSVLGLGKSSRLWQNKMLSCF